MVGVINEEVQIADSNFENEHVNKANSPFVKQSGKFSRVTSLHNRSFKDNIISGKALWEDEYGNRLMGMNLKGRLERGKIPFLEKDKYSKLGIRTHWLCDTTDVERTEQVSDIMRSNHLPTERIRRKSILNKLEVAGKLMDSAELKVFLQENINELGDKKLKYWDYLANIDFYEIEREVPVDERIDDLRNANENSGEKIKELLTPTFKYLKLVDGIELDINNEEDIRNFVTDILPKRMGSYLGKFHDLGLKFTYAGGKNWILTGHLVDLDSVHGTPLGEPAPSNLDIEEDINQTLGAISSIFLIRGMESGYFWKLWDDDPEKMKEQIRKSFNNFLDSYKEQRKVSHEYMVDHIDPDILEYHQVSLK